MAHIRYQPREIGTTFYWSECDKSIGGQQSPKVLLDNIHIQKRNKLIELHQVNDNKNIM